MNKSGLFTSAMLMLVFASCGGSNTEQDHKAAVKQEIVSLRDSLVTDDLKRRYVELVDSISRESSLDSSLEMDLIEAAKVCTKKGEYAKATSIRTRYVQLFPNGREVPEQIFAIGFSYHNDMKQLDSARKYFEIMLVDYPDHKLTEFAKFELKHLGQDSQDIVDDFLKQNGMKK